MQRQNEEKVWAVVEMKENGEMDVSVFDNEADATNYCIEMQARHENKKEVQMQQTILNRRDADIATDDAPWGALRFDVKTEFVEGLMEDMVPFDQIRPGAAERFVCEKIPMVRRRALDRLHEILKQETQDALNVCQKDWCGDTDMED